MKRFLLALVLCIFSITAVEATNQVSTRFGNITLPTTKELSSQIDKIAQDANFSDENKNRLSALCKQGLDALTKIDSLQKKQTETTKTIGSYKKILNDRQKDLNAEQKKPLISIDEVEKMTDAQIVARADKLTGELDEAKLELDRANAEHNFVQTLPEKAQGIVTENKENSKNYLNNIEKSGDITILENRIYALFIYASNLENTVYQTQLSNLSTLQDLTNLTFKIATSKYNRISNDLKILNLKQQQNTESIENSQYAIELDKIKNVPELAKVYESNQNLKSYVSKSKKDLADYQADYQRVDNANARVEQIEKTLQSQIKELNKTLILSRLLNKQHELLPHVQLKYDVDDTIANLNIYIYEIRERADKLIDIEDFVEKEITKNPQLADYKSDMVVLYSTRKKALNDLYQALADMINQTIDIKIKYGNYQKIATKIEADIEEQLFWIKSNQPIGSEFFKLLIPAIYEEFNNLVTKLNSQEFKTNTLSTFNFVIIPLLILGLVIRIFRNKFKRISDNLALRLDHTTDSIFVTPLAILNNIIMVVPKMTWMIFIGSVVICTSLGKSNLQIHVILAMVLHIFVFVFFLEILKPNGLVQRHFSVEPQKLKHYRSIFSYVWSYALPLLIFANVAESDSTNIYADLASHMIVLFSCIGLLVLSVRLLVKNISQMKLTSATYICTCVVAISVLALAVFFVASGYLYTIVKLTNRFAYTCYIIIAYYLISQTAHRMIYVYTNKVYRRKHALENAETTGEKIDVVAHLVAALNASPATFCAKIFKLTNIVLIAITVILFYMQWSDLASVLRYLDTVHLWNKTEISNGSLVVVDYLSVANVLFAMFIVALTSVINRNLPTILEKLLLIKKSEKLKSTSYSVKVISSYIIIGLGTIFTAGALGIKWENLQWLVAALSVGLGFGLQEIFANFVSGIILLFERQLRVGDIITLNSLSGTVSKIRIRSTTVMSFENKEVMIPNREFITSALTNWSLSSTVTKIEFNVGIAYGADVEKAKSILRNIVNKCKYISKDHASLIYIKALAASEVTLACEVYVGAIGERKLTVDYLSNETLTSFAKAGIEIPFNQLDLHLRTLEQDEFLEKIKNGLLTVSDKLPAPSAK